MDKSYVERLADNITDIFINYGVGWGMLVTIVAFLIAFGVAFLAWAFTFWLLTLGFAFFGIMVTFSWPAAFFSYLILIGLRTVFQTIFK